jgi:hypothetical protein
MDRTQARTRRYREQSSRYRESATSEMRAGHWDRVEEFLWGSLVGAVKAVAASRGDDPKTDEETRRYAAALARESRDRRLGDAFDQVSGFANTYLRVLDSRLGPERLYLVVERVGRAVETLWGMLPLDEETD